MRKPVPTLQGETVLLRPPRIEDAAARLALGNHPEIVRMYGGGRERARAITPADAERWVQSLLNHPCAWIIDAGSAIGSIRLDRIDLHDRRASLAIGIDDPTRLGRGLGTEAIRLVLQHAFTDLSLHRIAVRVLAFNQRAIRVYQKCGFRIEGLEREAASIDGAWYDDVIMGLLDREFIDA